VAVHELLLLFLDDLGDLADYWRARVMGSVDARPPDDGDEDIAEAARQRGAAAQERNAARLGELRRQASEAMALPCPVCMARAGAECTWRRPDGRTGRMGQAQVHRERRLLIAGAGA
jgi:hypothetical protein